MSTPLGVKALLHGEPSLAQQLDSWVGAPLLELGPGDTVTVSAGKQGFTPHKFSTLEVGPVTVTTTVRPGETGKEAYVRASLAAQTMFEAEYSMAKSAYEARYKEHER